MSASPLGVGAVNGMPAPCWFDLFTFLLGIIPTERPMPDATHRPHQATDNLPIGCMLGDFSAPYRSLEMT